MKQLILILTLAWGVSVGYGTVYVRDTTGLGIGKYGLMNGSDWANALPNMPNVNMIVKEMNK